MADSSSQPDSPTLLQYKDHFVEQLLSLGVVLGVTKAAAAILATQASYSDKYIQITDKWMRCTAIPTWDKFCSCLKKNDDFTRVRTLIEQKQLGRHKEDLAGRPSESDLQRISLNTDQNWRVLLQSLKIDEARPGWIETLAFRNPNNIANACFKGLMFWVNGNALQPVTWSTLIEAQKKTADLTKKLPPKVKQESCECENQLARITSNGPTKLHDGVWKMQVLNRIYCSWRDPSANAPIYLTLPHDLELENKFDKLLRSIKYELRGLSRLNEYNFSQLCDAIAQKCRRHDERAHGGCLPILITPEDAFNCIDKESHIFDPVVVHQVIDEIDNLVLKTLLKDFEATLISFCETALTSNSPPTTSLHLCDDRHAHMAVLCSEEAVLLSLINNMKYYFKKHLELDDIFFDGYRNGCTIVYFTISKEDISRFRLKILSLAQDLQNHFSLTHLVIFNHFVCDLEQKAIDSIDTQSLNQRMLPSPDHDDDAAATDDDGQQPQPSQQWEQHGACTKSARWGRSCSWPVGLLLLTAALMVAWGGVCTWSGLTCAAADCVAGGPRYCPSLCLQFLCSLCYPATNQSDQEENMKSTTTTITPSRSSDSDKMTSVPTLDEKVQVPQPTPQLSPTKSQTDSHFESHFHSKKLEQTNHALTAEEVDQLEQFRVKKGSVIWMEVGVTGAGMSCLGNFILGQDDSFTESVIMAISETNKAALKCSSFESDNLCVIDTPGLGDTGNVGSFTSDAKDVAYDYSKLALELTKVMMMTMTMMPEGQDINAFLIVVQGNTRDYRSLQALLYFCDIIGAYWNHSILVVTHGKEYGNTEEEQYATFHEKVLAHPKYPALLKKLMDKVSNRLVIVESKDWRSPPEYHRSVVGKIMNYSKEIAEQHGPFKDELQPIGRQAYEKVKLELRNKFEDMNSSDAQEAVLQSTFTLVRDMVYRLVRIKMANGEDVDKMKEMAEVKKEELDKVRKQRDALHKEYMEEQLRRKEAEEKQRSREEKRSQADEKRSQAEERRRQAEVRQMQEEEARKQTQRRLEAECLQKDTFKNRIVTARVYNSDFYSWDWVHSAEAIDEVTGTRVTAKRYKSKGGAIEHAKLTLKAVLLDKGIIRNDD